MLVHVHACSCIATGIAATHPYGGGGGQCLLLQHLDDLLLLPPRLCASRLLHVCQQVAPGAGSKHRRGVVGRGRAVAVRDRPNVLLRMEFMGCLQHVRRVQGWGRYGRCVLGLGKRTVCRKCNPGGKAVWGRPPPAQPVHCWHMGSVWLVLMELKVGLARLSRGPHLGARLDIVHDHSMSGRVDQGRVIEEANLAPVA